jgi:type IV fimbrial biogenesis protein FimT
MLKNSRGLTLIELIVGLVVLAVLISFGAGGFTTWVRNAGIRTQAESVLAGLQLARTEALTGNAVTRFQLVDALDNGCALDVNGPHWVVSRDDATALCGETPSATATPRIVQIHNGEEAAGKRTAIDAPDNLFTFNGLGRLTYPVGDAVIDIQGAEGVGDCYPNGKQLRCMRIEITRGGGIRLCDPALLITDYSQGCK